MSVTSSGISCSVGTSIISAQSGRDRGNRRRAPGAGRPRARVLDSADGVPKPVSGSRVYVTHLTMPGDANSLGSAFGGIVMQWADLAAGMAAMRHARLP